MNLRILLPLLSVLLVPPGPRASAQEAGPGIEVGPTHLELAIWRTPSFQRRFAESFRSEAAIEPSVSTAEIELMSEAVDLMAANDIDGAISLLESERTRRSSAAIDFMLGNLLYVQARLDESAKALEAAVAKFPDFRRAWMRFGDLEARRGNVTGAHRALVEAYRLGAGDANTIGLLGWANAGLGHWVAAESAYRQALMLDPGSHDWRLGLAEALVRQLRPREALVLLGDLIEERSGSAALWALQAEAHLSAGQPAMAAQDLEFLEGLGGATFDSRSTLGDIYLQQGMPSAAADRHLAAMELEEAPDPARAIIALRRLARDGEVEAAAMMADQLRRLHVGGFDSREVADLEDLETRIAVRKGEGAEEIAALEEIVDGNPLDGDAIILLGRCYGRMPEGLERAEYWFKRASLIDGVRVEAMLRHAEVLISRGSYGPAIILLKKVQLEQPRASVKALLDRVERYERQRSRESVDGGGR